MGLVDPVWQSTTAPRRPSGGPRRARQQHHDRAVVPALAALDPAGADRSATAQVRVLLQDERIREAKL